MSRYKFRFLKIRFPVEKHLGRRLVLDGLGLALVQQCRLDDEAQPRAVVDLDRHRFGRPLQGVAGGVAADGLVGLQRQAGRLGEEFQVVEPAPALVCG